MPLVRATETGREQTEDTRKRSVDVGLGPVSGPACMSEVLWKKARYSVIGA